MWDWYSSGVTSIQLAPGGRIISESPSLPSTSLYFIPLPFLPPLSPALYVRPLPWSLPFSSLAHPTSVTSPSFPIAPLVVKQNFEIIHWCRWVNIFSWKSKLLARSFIHRNYSKYLKIIICTALWQSLETTWVVFAVGDTLIDWPNLKTHKNRHYYFVAAKFISAIFSSKYLTLYLQPWSSIALYRPLPISPIYPSAPSRSSQKSTQTNKLLTKNSASCCVWKAIIGDFGKRL